MSKRKYLPEGLTPHVGSSGFLNYWRDRNTEDTSSLAARALKENEGCVVLNGQDDWTSPEWKRPETFCRTLGVEPVALFHTGISGVTSSGVVISKEDFNRLQDEYVARYGHDLTQAVKVYS